MKIWGEGVNIKYQKMLFFKTLSTHKKIIKQKKIQNNADLSIQEIFIH